MSTISPHEMSRVPTFAAIRVWRWELRSEWFERPQVQTVLVNIGHWTFSSELSWDRKSSHCQFSSFCIKRIHLDTVSVKESNPAHKTLRAFHPFVDLNLIYVPWERVNENWPMLNTEKRETNNNYYVLTEGVFKPINKLNIDHFFVLTYLTYVVGS